MKARLVCHPDTPATAVRGITAEARRDGRILHLRYVLTGDMATIVVPAPAAPERADGLWRTTCFEAFVAGQGEDYLELNLAPSGQWAAYAFEGYRAGMREAEVPAPDIKVECLADRLLLTARIDLPLMTRDDWQRDDWQVGLSAVVEGSDGKRSYWALAHAADKPDFHDRACFTAVLRAAPAP